MQKAMFILRKSLLSSTVLLVCLFGIHPALAAAATSQNPDPATTSTTASSTSPSGPSTTQPSSSTTSSPTTPSNNNSTTQQPQTGPTKPNGADANTYHYNSVTGMWENDHYIWNPVTQQTTPKTSPSYSYNPATGMWDTTQWRYDAPSGTYVPNIVSVNSPPAGTITNSATTQAGTGNGNGNTSTINNPSYNALYNNFYNASISNNISSNAFTGNAGVTGNTSAGSATSGNALDVANVLNLLQSTASLSGGKVATFVSNINGDVNGNLLIDPSSMVQPANSLNTQALNNLQINSKVNGQINDTIALGATSGNASVVKNTSAGNATTGNADAVANVMNMINSVVAANQSFMGMVNIYGNLNGNILMPAQFLDNLIASNAPSTTVNASQLTNSNLLANFNNNQNISNQVSASAQSGQAAVTENSKAGNAITGNASTNVTIFNLTGNQIIGKNALLVFVNVLGKWVGVIMNAPAGSTAAMLGGGITQNSNILPAATATTIAASNTDKINNAITVNANSGNATVADNTAAGNAQSGNAATGVNLLNLTNSQFSLSNWFGVLFINVFGNWNGNFGVSDPTATAGASSNSSANTNSTSSNTKGIHVFKFMPTGNNGNQFKLASASVSSDIQATSNTTGAGHVIGISTVSNNHNLTNMVPSPITNIKNTSQTRLVAGFIVLSGLLLFGIERFVTLRQHRQQT